MGNRKEFLERRNQLPKDKRLRETLADLFLSGEISGKRARSLYEDAEDAEAVNVSDVASGSTDHNAHRDVLRRLLHKTKWPDLFECDIPIYDPRTNNESVAHVSMLLPHELVHTICRWNLDSIDEFASVEDLRPELAKKMEEVQSFLQGSSASPLPLVGLGLWADGVPIKGDRSESLEMITLSFPGLGQRQSIRIPLTVMNKKFFLKDGRTWDALFKVISWSCQSLLSGCFPSHRWDGTPLPGQKGKPCFTCSRSTLGNPWRLGNAEGILSNAQLELQEELLFCLPGYTRNNERFGPGCTMEDQAVEPCRAIDRDARIAQ